MHIKYIALFVRYMFVLAELRLITYVSFVGNQLAITYFLNDDGLSEEPRQAFFGGCGIGTPSCSMFSANFMRNDLMFLRCLY